MSAPGFVMERHVPGYVTFHEGWEGMKGTLGGPDCGCVKCLTARWKAAWESHTHGHVAVPSEFEVRRLFTEMAFNCFKVK